MRPFVKRQKNDAADAEAIVIAARQPEIGRPESSSANHPAWRITKLARQLDLLSSTRLGCILSYK
jgi:hypothetical protein